MNSEARPYQAIQTGHATHQTQVRGLLQASNRSASGEPSAGFWSYSQRAVSGRDMRMLQAQYVGSESMSARGSHSHCAS